jgi:hypothetical protein
MAKILNSTKEHSTWYTSNEQGNDILGLSIPPGQYFQSCRITILSPQPNSNAFIASQPLPGQTGNTEIVVNWKCAAHSTIKYQLETFSDDSPIPTTTLPPVTRQMTHFLPSKNGFHFDNSFKPVPTELNTPLGPIQIGDASKGLCGGMIYTAIDYFNAGLDIPSDTDLPANDMLFDYVVKRLLESFDIPTGPLQYIELMHPDYPDGFSANKRGPLPIGRSWRMIRQEWPKIKATLDTGQPCPLGLILIKSKELKELGKNHQVLTYGYDLTGDDLTFYIYDPNYHGNDNITMKLKVGDPEHPTKVIYSSGESVLCFFKTKYTFSMPPGETTLPGRIILFEDRGFEGNSIDIQKASPDLNGFKEGSFNDRVSSFVILSGNWSFYRNVKFDGPFLFDGRPVVLKPGAYSWVEDLGIKDNEISSLKVVKERPNYKHKWIFF